MSVLLTAVVVSVPFSVKLYARAWDLEVIFPAEPLIALLALVVVWRSITLPRSAWRALWVDPVVIAVLAYVLSSMISTTFSALPMVSLKALMVRLAYITVFVLGPLLMAGRGMGAVKRLQLHAWLLVPIVLWSIAGQVEGGMDRASAGFVPWPFYADHTIYGAALTFGVLALGVGGMGVLAAGADRGRGVLMLVGAVLLLIGVLLSFTRAAWLATAVVIVFALLVLVYHRWPRATKVLAPVVAVLVVWSIGNRQGARVNASAHRSGVATTLASFTNLSTDPSNAERLNRWSCAWRMFLDRPLTGHGPSTYQFVFLPYQRPDERSPISLPDTLSLARYMGQMMGKDDVAVRPPSKDLQFSGGTAHSEYLLALSETGAPGALTFIAVMVVALWSGMKVLCVGGTALSKAGIVLAVLGLVSYGTHGLFNNFLDDCKIAMPFWLSVALLAGLSRPGATSQSV